jgi:hypothetical protein
MVNLGQGSHYRSRGSIRVDSGQCKDKSCYYHSFKPILGVNRNKAQVTGWEGQHGLTRVNVWIQVVIIIVLKSDSGVNSRQGSGNGLGGSTRLT